MGRCSPYGFCRNLYPSPARHVATGPQEPRSTGARTDPYTFTRCERHHRAVQSGTRRFHQCQSRQGLHRCPPLLPLSEPQAGRARVCPHPAGRTFQSATDPYPILPGHLTISTESHQWQTLADKTSRRLPERLVDWLEKHFASGYTVFYNGAKCGASAPDHFHFQAVRRKMCPSSANGKD